MSEKKTQNLKRKEKRGQGEAKTKGKKKVTNW